MSRTFLYKKDKIRDGLGEEKRGKKGRRLKTGRREII